MYIIGHLIALFAVPIWIYFDLKRFRGRGVPTSPGGIASLFFILSFVALFLGGVGFRSFFYSASPIVYMLEPFLRFVPLFIPLGIYVLLRTFYYQKLARLGSPPLPTPRFSGGNIVFMLLLILPFFAIIVIPLFYFRIQILKILNII